MAIGTETHSPAKRNKAELFTEWNKLSCTVGNRVKKSPGSASKMTVISRAKSSSRGYIDRVWRILGIDTDTPLSGPYLGISTWRHTVESWKITDSASWRICLFTKARLKDVRKRHRRPAALRTKSCGSISNPDLYPPGGFGTAQLLLTVNLIICLRSSKGKLRKRKGLISEVETSASKSAGLLSKVILSTNPQTRA